MARVTVEDCTKVIPNRFELVVLASRRAKDISAGAKPTVEKDNDKDAVIALREIADETVSEEQLIAEVIESYQDQSKYKFKIIEKADEPTDPEIVEEVTSTTEAQEGVFSDDNIEIDD